MTLNISQDVFAVHIGTDFDENYDLPVEIILNTVKINFPYARMQERIAPFCSVWNGDILRKVLKHFSLASYVSEARVFYDTAGLVTAVCRNKGFRDIKIDRKDYVRHYGGLTSLIANNYEEAFGVKIREIQKQLKLYE